MVTRSVPGYYDMQQLTARFAQRVCQPGSLIYDFGCSSGTSIAFIKRSINFPISFIGIDSSPEMIEKCRNKLAGLGLAEGVELRVADICTIDLIHKASLSIFNLTLQFLSPNKRIDVLKKICDNTEPGGAIIISEKVTSSQPELQNTIQQLHWNFKREAGYSELEIARKRDSLEDVLTPLKAEENLDLIRRAGFKEVEILYKNLNFAVFIGIK
jgi:tRNA (cmo5U34)-methyltransferase